MQRSGSDDWEVVRAPEDNDVMAAVRRAIGLTHGRRNPGPGIREPDPLAGRKLPGARASRSYA